MIAIDDDEERLGLMSREQAVDVMKACDGGLVASLLEDGADPATVLRDRYPYA